MYYITIESFSIALVDFEFRHQVGDIEKFSVPGTEQICRRLRLSVPDWYGSSGSSVLHRTGTVTSLRSALGFR